jgi:uncharacterized protein YdaU (DUF1376 family)
MKALPYYKFFVQDWRASRKVRRMSITEKGIYRELLDEAWVEGSIPSGMSELAEICDCPEQVLADAWHKVGKCFVDAGNGRLVNLRLNEERTETDQKRAAKALAGRAGGLAKSHASTSNMADAKQLKAGVNGCHIVEKRREELPPKPPKGGGRRRTRTEILTPFPEGTRRVVNTLGAEWHKEDPRDGRKISISPEGFAQAVERIKAEQPQADDETLIEAGRNYLAEKRERYQAPQWFFGVEGPWGAYIRAILTRREHEAGRAQPLQAVSA